MYSSTDADVHSLLGANAMSRDMFDGTLRYLHFNDNQNLNTYDKLTKIRPLMNSHLNDKCMQAYPMDQHLDLDEAMIEYYGRHGCKQCIRNKPVRVGFKAWCINSRLGYLTVFDIYQDSSYGSTGEYEGKFGKGGGTLLVLFDKLSKDIRSLPLKFYFDNYFTGLPLINQLSILKYGATGTIKENRIPQNSLLRSTKTMKTEARGSIDVVYDKNNKISLVPLKDNGVVTFVSNMLATDSLQKAQRWSMVEKKKVSISQPFLSFIIIILI